MWKLLKFKQARHWIGYAIAVPLGYQFKYWGKLMKAFAPVSDLIIKMHVTGLFYFEDLQKNPSDKNFKYEKASCVD